MSVRTRIDEQPGLTAIRCQRCNTLLGVLRQDENQRYMIHTTHRRKGGTTINTEGTRGTAELVCGRCNRHLTYKALRLSRMPVTTNPDIGNLSVSRAIFV